MLKENLPPVRRGRFLVQEVEEMNEINHPIRKHRCFSIENKIILDKSIFIVDDNEKVYECYLYDFENSQWIDSDKIWGNTLNRIKNEKEHMEIIFFYDLINTKEELLHAINPNQNICKKTDPNFSNYYTNKSQETCNLIKNQLS